MRVGKNELMLISYYNIYLINKRIYLKRESIQHVLEITRKTLYIFARATFCTIALYRNNIQFIIAIM